MSAQTQIKTIAPILPVSDLQTSLRFYAAMGFLGDAWDDQYAMILRGESGIHLRLETTPLKENNPSGAYFYVETGIGDLYAEFLANHVPFCSPLAIREWKMNEFQVSDPDGNLLRFGEPLSKT